MEQTQNQAVRIEGQLNPRLPEERGEKKAG